MSLPHEPIAYDALTLGEPLIRFAPDLGQRIEQTLRWQSHVGGSELNTAVGLARLGLRVGYITRLTANGLGYQIRNTLRQNGVDTGLIRWTDADRVGTYYLEPGTPPRPSQVIYDRGGSAASKMTPADLDEGWFRPPFARLLHVTGISLAVSASLAATVLHAAQLAKRSGWLVSFDVNYRAKLWRYADAAKHCEPLLTMADIIFVPYRDAIQLWPASEMSKADVLQTLHRHYPNALCVVTMGTDGVQAVDAAGNVVSQPAFGTEPLDPIGGGDAFSAGMLYQYLTTSGQDVGLALRWGAAAAALKYTITGDLPLMDAEEIARLVSTPMAQETRR